MPTETQETSNGCEVCGQPRPEGHLICDECWPDKALSSGRAGLCARCGRPRLVEKLRPDPDHQGRMVCADHLAASD